ncbi:hypothetical protein [Actinomadura sp. SCN-SB]
MMQTRYALRIAAPALGVAVAFSGIGLASPPAAVAQAVVRDDSRAVTQWI